jgi:hypothetical protein
MLTTWIQGQKNLQYRLPWYARPLPNLAILLLNGLDEQLKMNDCYYDKKDWRACRKEVSAVSLNPNRQ